MTKTQSQKLLQLDELLLGELLQQLKPPTASGDAARRVELQVWQAMISKELAKLQKGGEPEPVSQFENKRRFFQAADGLKWHLNGTKNVEGCTISNGILSILAMEGGAPRPAVSGICHAAGVISHDRSDRSRTYYIISPDLRIAHCVIASQLFIGFPVRAEAAESREHPAEAKPPSKQAQGDDIIDFMLARRRTLMETQTRERWKVLTAFRSADTLKDDSFARRYAEAQIDIEDLDKDASHAVEEGRTPSLGAFKQRVADLIWRIPKAGEFERLRFDGTNFELLDGSGTLRAQLAAKVIWPGLFRVLDLENKPLLIWFAPDLSQILLMRSRGEFTGQQVKR